MRAWPMETSARPGIWQNFPIFTLSLVIEEGTTDVAINPSKPLPEFDSLRLPVLQQRNRRRTDVFQKCVNKKAAVSRNVELNSQIHVRAPAHNTRAEQWRRGARLDRGSIDGNGCGH